MRSCFEFSSKSGVNLSNSFIPEFPQEIDLKIAIFIAVDYVSTGSGCYCP